ncbi:23S rRNA m(5)U-1939 methyltransferase [Faunimonas pinastri]|uniref:23S rRNA m(5)U-1939 methyltransferase n=1 Tax=Faunimonas pinastri TaxID=1855383 RepID=A0A1H8ZWY1_9HYPH|nr:class I SAM-dependent RNA methyltransferase [Faunimonas pinastri]SEP68835.1 23S rRNA m(5)U-1939 methyltransferase [Faunimonas pinastri]
MPEILTVETIGHRGDGIAQGARGPVYVPFSLPGERISAEVKGDRARILDIVEPSPDRVAPICKHFGICGNCALQMMPLEQTRDLKRSFVQDSLDQQKIEVEAAPTIGVRVDSRRRVVLTVAQVEGKLVMGYHRRLSNEIFNVEECPVAVPAIQAKLGDLRTLVGKLGLGRKPARINVLATDNGLDVSVTEAPKVPSRLVSTLLQATQAADFARLTVNGEMIATFAEPMLMIAGTPMVTPPGAFIQASAEAEAVMIDLMLPHLAGSKRVADLFAGFGTFSLALARTAAVRAVESSPVALAALGDAIRRAQGLKAIETERRDLFEFPVQVKELKGFDGAVFDPPRVGAREQAAVLAGSKLPRIAAVSCNPASFARDARVLIDGGYRLERVVPIDQFVYSAETEVIGLFLRN